MAKDPYSILGVSRDASPEDIKKAYRKMSKELHPDKHKGEKGAEDKFKEINEAYETLSNPERKRMYDQFGSTGGPGQGGGGGFGGFDFSNFNGNADFGDLGDIFGSFFGGGRRGRQDPSEGLDREIEVTIDLMDAVHGSRHEIRVRRFVACETCAGKGAEPGTEIITCETCGGTGQVVQTVNSFFGQIQQRSVCPTCQGSGKVPKTPCHTCKGEGRLEETRDVTIEIPAGIEEGQVLRVQGQGDAGLRSGKTGDLFVHIRILSHPQFKRDHADIRASAKVPVIDAILGGTVEVDTVQGKATLQVPEGMQPGQLFRIRGKGMPILGTSRFGDHYVTLNVDIPQKLSKAERKILEEWRKTADH